MSRRAWVATLLACAAGLSGCQTQEPIKEYFATWDMFADAFAWPAGWPHREFQRDGAFLPAERFRQFPQDQVFVLQGQVIKPRPGEAESPTMRLRGLYEYQADAARFVDCNTSWGYPVLMEGEQVLRLEKAYLDARSAPGARVQVSIDGRLVVRQKVDGSGAEQFVLVEKFYRVVGPSDCTMPQS